MRYPAVGAGWLSGHSWPATETQTGRGIDRTEGLVVVPEQSAVELVFSSDDRAQGPT
ncbi:hypothetical protein [Halocatena salina]|uniref:Uncharacterized protein n=1 Tax=Halocatena salina TaxID=2934340 RepID=A0A8U0A6P8_9EURY|nr:hypothetical protein [Halocatena salina]UPM44539.1 hypothetical protein MW046_14010 [Halocatena salina]